jgi:hypothetical protein
VANPPSDNDQANIYYSAFNRYPRIVDGVTGIAQMVLIGPGAGQGTIPVYIEGGLLWVGQNLTIGDASGVQGRLEMTGGRLVVGNSLDVGANGTGIFQLYGGTATAAVFSVASNLYSYLDVGGGTLVINGNVTNKIAGYVADGLVIAYDGNGSVQYDYNVSVTGKTSVRGSSFYTSYGPTPESGATDLPVTNVVLRWKASAHASPTLGHDVYFGSDSNAVATATTASTNVYLGRVTATNYTIAGPLTVDQTYYWRIDEVNTNLPGSPWKGAIWSFTPGKPRVFWTSLPNYPDEAVLVRGNGFWSIGHTKVQLARLPDDTIGNPNVNDPAPTVAEWTDAQTVMSHKRGIHFILPVASDMPAGVYAYRIITGGKTSDIQRLNRPDPWWTLGDTGSKASPGGWIRVQGRAINLDKNGGGATNVRLAFVQGGATIGIATAQQAEAYSARFPIPASVTAGTYTVYIHNGYGGNAGWVRCATKPLDSGAHQGFTISNPVVWPTNVFNITTFTNATDTLRFRAALNAASNNGGGVVYVPAGTYSISNIQMRVPNKTIVRGDGSGLSVLRWPTNASANKDEYVFTGGEYAFENLHLDFVSHTGHLINTWGQFRIQDCKISRYLNVNNKPQSGIRTINCSGDNIQIIGNEFTGLSRGIQTEANHVQIISNYFHSSVQGGNAIQAEDGYNTLIEHNNIKSYGITLANYGGPYSDFYYLAHNTVPGWSTDGGDGPYLGYIESVNGTNMLLAGSLNLSTGTLYDYCGVYILDGRGEGQYRHMKSRNGRNITLDRAWDVDPDGSSIVHLVTQIGRAILYRNQFVGDWVWAYRHSTDIVYSQNTVTYPNNWMNGWMNAGGGGRNQAILPGWNAEWYDNVIVTGNVQLGYTVNTLSDRLEDRTPLHIEFLKGRSVGDGIVFRNNIAHSNTASASRIELSGAFANHNGIIENNHVSTNSRSGNFSHVLVRGNRWLDDRPTYVGFPASSQTLLVWPAVDGADWPSPVHGATLVATNVTLSWTGGSGVTWRDVYVGTNFAQVANATTNSGGLFKGTQSATTYAPAGLAHDTRYYWRVDEVKSGARIKGQVWQFTTIVEAPALAASPAPGNGATPVEIDATLAWTAGARATSHRVYIGTNAASLAYAGEQTATTHDPGPLAYDTTHYWRIDGVNEGGVTTGDVWSFTTIIEAPGLASAPSPDSPSSSTVNAPTLSWSAGARAAERRVYFGTSAAAVGSANSGDPEHVATQSSTSYAPGTLAYNATYYWRIDEMNAGGVATGPVWNFTVDMPSPSTPTNLQAEGIYNGVDLIWSAAAFADSYTVKRATNSGGPYATIATGVADTSLADTNLGLGVTYYYVVAAVNAVSGSSGDSAEASATTESLLSPWETVVIGNVTYPGHAFWSNGTYFVGASGSDIWNASDHFRYVYQLASGDCDIIGRVTSVQNVDSWTKFGVMIRESVATNAEHMAVHMRPTVGVSCQWRLTAGGNATQTAVSIGAPPKWVRVNRTGNTFTGYYSTNGTNWTTINSKTITMSSNVLIGISLTSHNNSTMATGTITSVTATP